MGWHDAYVPELKIAVRVRWELCAYEQFSIIFRPIEASRRSCKCAYY
jgi:hypothetical protein